MCGAESEGAELEVGGELAWVANKIGRTTGDVKIRNNDSNSCGTEFSTAQYPANQRIVVGEQVIS
jgi:hypothetical protein